MSFDLLDGLPLDEVKAIRQSLVVRQVEVKKARAIRTHSKRMVRRANCEKTLNELLPLDLADGTSWHVISHGDIDSLSFLRHVVHHQRLDIVHLSTWCMAREDLAEIATWLADGRIGALHLFAGEIFPSQYGDEYELARRLVADYAGRVVIARNHSKVMLGLHEATGYAVVIESSANVNTNPRIEQTAIHRDGDLYWFYRDFFDELRTIDRDACKPI